ncbi:MAG TPA: DUF2235 domain-containing protein [Fibrobacteria bacterium]|nr:DUF2235 domain-containing protein [Fibrobacteria bacterium]
MDDKTKFKKLKLPLVPLAQNAGQSIQVGIFFDGTDNNRQDDLGTRMSNIAKLYDLYKADQRTSYKFYCEGVGTGSILESDYITGGFSGRGITYRIWRTCRHLDDVLGKHHGAQLELHVFGFSRGSATALSFINQLSDWNLFGKDRVGFSGREFANLPLPFPKVKFLGLFDIVGSIGLPGIETFDAHDLTIHASRISHLTHFVSRDEKRILFPLTSIHSVPGSPLPPNWEERIFPGVHSDVGGGYMDMKYHPENSSKLSTNGGRDETDVEIGSKQSDYLARVSAWAMHDAAERSGIPWIATNINEPASIPSVENLLNLESSIQEPESGWTTFSISSGYPDRYLGASLIGLKIHPRLHQLWNARNDPDAFAGLISRSNQNYITNIEPFLHDSGGLEPIRRIYFKGAA